jgi:DNA-binding MarR family transcriptional regulator
MSFDTADNLGTWLFYTQLRVAYAFAEALRSACQEHGKQYAVTPPQWGILALLMERDGLTIGTLSQRRNFDAPTITGVVKRLEQSGLVERRHSREDRRQVHVHLTQEGHDCLRFLPGAVQDFYRTLTRGFSESELADLRTKLRQVVGNVYPGTNEQERDLQFATRDSWFISEDTPAEMGSQPLSFYKEQHSYEGTAQRDSAGNRAQDGEDDIRH